MSHNLDELVEKLSQLSVLDMAKLKEKLEEKWGVKAAVAMAAAPAGAAAAAAAPASESTEFKVTLEGPIPDDKKISVIKAVREVTGLGLKEAKDLVEGAPKDLKLAAPKAEAEEIQKKIQTAGGKVKLTGL
jgi:large subunit ribosomal protein L7/L12